MNPKLLIVEDDNDIGVQMKWALSQDFEVYLARDRQSALQAFQKERPALVTLDLGLPPDPHGVKEGFETLSDMLAADSDVKVLVITGQGDRAHARAAIGEGAYDFFPKPIDVDELKLFLGRALHVYELEQEHRVSQRDERLGGFDDLLGASPKMVEVYETIRRAAPTDAPVLICGESGTGKELVARALHRHSARREGAFVAINCGAIPEHLLESELFGHEKGAFTGAHQRRQGRLELAHGGTLFLDEIGELPLPLQVKLLRFLQERVVERVGGRRAIAVDTRVVAATNLDLDVAMAARRFREDLYYRLGVVRVMLPPLRERGGDLMMLAQRFLQRFAGETKAKLKGFDAAALMAMQDYDWPGNVRELENRIQRAVIMARGSTVTWADLELSSSDASDRVQTLREVRETAERDLIARELARHQGNITHTAAALGVSRPTLHGLMEKYALKR